MRQGGAYKGEEVRTVDTVEDIAASMSTVQGVRMARVEHTGGSVRAAVTYMRTGEVVVTDEDGATVTVYGNAGSWREGAIEDARLTVLVNGWGGSRDVGETRQATADVIYAVRVHHGNGTQDQERQRELTLAVHDALACSRALVSLWYDGDYRAHVTYGAPSHA
jgi:hypothetical protein